jgi:hypothetical protein
MTDEKKHQDDENIYQDYLKESLQNNEDLPRYSYKGQSEIIKVGKGMARRTNIMITLAILLLIIPVMTLMTYLYYAVGGRANDLIEVVSKTIYVTEPNMSLEEMELESDIGFFSMDITFDVFKRIGKEDFNVGDYFIHFAFDQASFPEKDFSLDRPLAENPTKESEVMLHPEASLPFSTTAEWNKLEKLPEGTVAEIYISLNEIMNPSDLKKMLPKQLELRWFAVDTGMEADQIDEEGVPITPIGYPAQIDTTIWSPFNGRDQSNEEVFIDILTLLEKNEPLAEQVSRAKSLALSERISYIKQNGINIYGAVITGPTEELRKLQNVKAIRAVKVGEVKLWNWE